MFINEIKISGMNEKLNQARAYIRRFVCDTLGAPRCGTLVEANYETPCGNTHAYSGHLAVMMLTWQIGIRLNTATCGGIWNSGGTCDNETEPIYDEQYLQMKDYIPMLEMVEGLLKGMKTPVYFLSVTRMSDF
ncbi:hypothetical protein LguiA_013217 [Lonicera macranthoides]